MKTSALQKLLIKQVSNFFDIDQLEEKIIRTGIHN